MTNDFNLNENGFHVENGVLLKYIEEDNEGDQSLIILPDNVTEIGEKAFVQNEDDGIGTVELEEICFNCTVIRAAAFYECSSLEIINCPEIEVLENSAFSGCANLVDFPELSDNIEVIPSYCYDDCSCLERFSLPEKAKIIEENAFYNTFNLSEIKWSPVLEVIGPEAFTRSGLSGELTLPDSLKNIGGGAFAECNKVTSIRLPKGIENIDETAFEEMENVETIYVPEGIEVPENLWGLDQNKVEVIRV